VQAAADICLVTWLYKQKQPTRLDAREGTRSNYCIIAWPANCA